MLYISKLNSRRNDLWQRPKKEIKDPLQDEWYDNQVIGRDPLNNAMKILSERAKLSQMYTNHCIRASVVTKLDEERFEARHIMVVSSHKSENSIKSYSAKCPENKKKEMFEALNQPFSNPPQPAYPQIDNNQIEIRQNYPPPQSNNALKNQNLQLVDMFPDMANDPLNDDHFLEAIQKIERENNVLKPVQNQNQTQVTTSNTVTSNYIQQVSRNVPTPHMYFSNSNVTINYNFNQK